VAVLDVGEKDLDQQDKPYARMIWGSSLREMVVKRVVASATMHVVTSTRHLSSVVTAGDSAIPMRVHSLDIAARMIG
jgi:hypothetical protein